MSVMYRGHGIELTRTGWFVVWLDLPAHESIGYAGERVDSYEQFKANTLSGACETIHEWERGELPGQGGHKPPPSLRRLYNVRNSTIDYDEVLGHEVFEEEEWEEDEA